MTAYKQGEAGTQQLERAVRWMRTLNRAAADVLRRFAPSAVTDVTGFGLLGHAHEMATRSHVRIELAAASLPALDGALESARAGVSTAGTQIGVAVDLNGGRHGARADDRVLRARRCEDGRPGTRHDRSSAGFGARLG